MQASGITAQKDCRMTRALLMILIVCACSVDSGSHAGDLEATTNLPSGGTGCSIDEETGVCRCTSSPIIVDVDGHGFDLTGPADGVMFQVQVGRIWKWSWTSAGSTNAFLAYPGRNGNATVDDGSELFGDGAPQALGGEVNGFGALAFYDRPENGGNGNGVMDPRDGAFDGLVLWADRNHNGVSEPEELVGLAKAGVRSIPLSFARSSIVDAHGNAFRFSGRINADAPVAPTIYDVWLQSDRAIVDGGGRTTNDTVIWTCKAWSYAVSVAGPHGPNNEGTLPCFGPGTGFDPILLMTPNIPDYPVPSYATMVVRTASATNDHGRAVVDATTRMRTDMGWSAICVIGPWPAHDRDQQGDYPYEMGDPFFEGRVKCQSVFVAPPPPPPSSGGC